MGWLSDGEDDAEESSVSNRLGTLAQLVAAGVVLFSAVGFGPVESAVERLGSTAVPVPSLSIDPAIGLMLLGFSLVGLLIVGGLALGAWYRLPDSPK